MKSNLFSSKQAQNDLANTLSLKEKDREAFMANPVKWIEENSDIELLGETRVLLDGPHNQLFWLVLVVVLGILFITFLLITCLVVKF